jgi:hypothetical protein
VRPFADHHLRALEHCLEIQDLNQAENIFCPLVHAEGFFAQFPIGRRHNSIDRLGRDATGALYKIDQLRND